LTDSLLQLSLLFKCLRVVMAITLSFPAVSNADETSSLSEHVRQSMIDTRVAGVSIARVESGQLAELITHGNVSADGNALEPSAVFQVGSISKSVTAWVAMTLVRDGKVDLDAPVHNYISRWAIPESEFDVRRVTLRRLLSHTAGLNLGGFVGFQPLPTIEEFLSGEIEGVDQLRLMQKPGEGYRYSGGGYTLIQLLVEEVTGSPFHEYAEKAVLRPLGMTNSSYKPDAELLARRVRPHGFNFDVIADRHFRAEAAASLHSTASDLAKFLIANVDQNSLLTSMQVATMHADVADAGFARVGLGFFRFADAELLGHSGANLGWRADFLFNIQTRSGLVVLTNSENGAALITSVRCFWDKRYGTTSLHETCIANRDNAHAKRRLFLILASITFAVALALLVWRLGLLLSKRASIGVPTVRYKLLALMLSIGALFAWLILVYTPLGARLGSGFATPFATIDYLPSSFEWFVFAIAALLSSISLSLFTHKISLHN